MDVARRCGADILDGKPVSAGDRFQYWLGNIFAYGPLKNVLGMSRIRVAYTAGAAIGPDLFRFYRSIGVNLKQLYGQTETCAYVCLQPDGHRRVHGQHEVRSEDHGLGGCVLRLRGRVGRGEHTRLDF
jgi:long-chain acyl-CoA synthetase